MQSGSWSGKGSEDLAGDLLLLLFLMLCFFKFSIASFHFQGEQFDVMIVENFDMCGVGVLYFLANLRS